MSENTNEHRWTRDEATWAHRPLTAAWSWSEPINALLVNSDRYHIEDFQQRIQVLQWAVEQLYDAGFALVGPAPTAQRPDLVPAAS